MRHPTKLEAIYQWEVTTPGHAEGICTNHATGDHHMIELAQQSDGIHWKVEKGQEDDERTCRVIQHLHRHAEEGSIVFYANPLLHRFPWKVPDSIVNKHVSKALKKQPFKMYCGDGPSLKGQLESLAQAVQSSKWQDAAMQQTPTQLWQHSHELTSYQVWVGYCVATRQLSLSQRSRKRQQLQKAAVLQRNQRNDRAYILELPSGKSLLAETFRTLDGGNMEWEVAGARVGKLRQQESTINFSIDSGETQKIISRHGRGASHTMEAAMAHHLRTPYDM